MLSDLITEESAHCWHVDPTFKICIASHHVSTIKLKTKTEMESATFPQKTQSRECRASYMNTNGRKAKEVMMESFLRKWASNCLVYAMLHVEEKPQHWQIKCQEQLSENRKTCLSFFIKTLSILRVKRLFLLNNATSPLPFTVN